LEPGSQTWFPNCSNLVEFCSLKTLLTHFFNFRRGRKLIEAIELIKNFEGFRDKPYLCPAGYWTCGFGHVIIGQDGEMLKGAKDKDEAFGIFNTPLTQKQASELLADDLMPVVSQITRLVKVPLNNNQLGALVSFVFNVGAGAFQNSTLLKILNQGHYDKVPEQFLRWTKAGKIVLSGLVKRRSAEVKLWLLPGV